MSNRTAESNKAIATAWKKEQELVSDGKGTRDWTQEQQQDILDRGKAYDENGKAFEGQHMRSVEMHPECQGDSDNIQFLTKEEHLAAHGGDWRNPTNGYYDPVTRVITDFGDGPIVPCKVIKLSSPLVKIEIVRAPQPEKIDKAYTVGGKKSSGTDPPKLKTAVSNKQNSNIRSSVNEVSKPAIIDTPGFFKIIGNWLVKVGAFVADHKEEIFGGILIVGSIATKEIIDSKSDSTCDQTNQYDSPFNEDELEDKSTSDGDTIPSNRSYPGERESPREHDVSGYTRHWNGKEIHVDPYKRGGKHFDEG